MSATPETSRKTTTRTVLAFDFGSQRIGVAVGQDLSATAEALATIKVKHGRIDWPSIARLVEDWQPDCFVLGDPRAGRDAPHPLDAALTRFGRQLEGRFHRNVHWVDEYLSSDEARRRGGQHHGKGLDAVAAELILETWFMQHQDDGETHE